jgi:chorismate-pyruvate lyase
MIRFCMNSGDPIQSVNVNQFALLQRILLTTDGTLTDTIEVAFLEKIDLVRLAILVSQATVSVPELDLEKGATLMERKILLRGRRSGVNYVYAESVLAVDRLDSLFRDQLVNSDMPLGRLWLEHRLETWKERLEIVRRPAAELSVHFGIDPQVEILGRTYRVFNNRRPIMTITEYFPQRYPAPAAN